MLRRPAALLLAVACSLVGLTVVATPVSAAPAPIGSFEQASARFGSPSPVAPNPWVQVLSGWAADPDGPGQSMWVHLWVDGRPFRAVQTGDARPDVQQAYPWAGPSTGWHTTVSARDVGAGSHTVCAYAIKIAGGANPSLGCKTLPTAGPSPYNPIGRLDVATASPGLVNLRGWAGDPDGTRTTRIRVYYDNGAEPMLDATASLPRPDVKAAFPALSATTGFNLFLPIMPGGHTICVYAQNSGRAGLQNAAIGCAAVVVPGVSPPGTHDPRGVVDLIYPANGSSCFGVHFHQCDWTAQGWAYDPDTAGPVQVRFRTLATNPLDAVQYQRSFVTASTGLARPDVEAAFPDAGPNAGFDEFLIATDNGRLRVVCAYLVNVGPGSSRLLECISR